MQLHWQPRHEQSYVWRTGSRAPCCWHASKHICQVAGHIAPLRAVEPTVPRTPPRLPPVPPPPSIEYNVSYVYHALYSYFSRDNVGLPGFAAFFKAGSAEERDHAEMLMDYQVRPSLCAAGLPCSRRQPAPG